MDSFDWSTYLRFVVALVFVLGLILMVNWLLRRFSPLAGRAIRGRDKRLEIVEIQPLDARRRLVLVRRDDQEHLLLLGQSTDLLVESGIQQRPVPGSVADQDGTPASLTTDTLPVANSDPK